MAKSYNQDKARKSYGHKSIISGMFPLSLRLLLFCLVLGAGMVNIKCLDGGGGTSNYVYFKWVLDIGSDINSSPAIDSQGTIYIGADDGLYAINPDSSRKWVYQTNDLHGSSPSLGSDGTVYVGSSDGLLAIDTDGSLKWDYPAPSFDENNSSTAIGSDDTIYWATNEGLQALDPDGLFLNKWVYFTGEVGLSPSVGSDGVIYLTTYEPGTYGNLYAINPDGSLKWSYSTNNFIMSSPSIGSDGTIYVPSNDGLLAFNTDGSLKWTSSDSEDDTGEIPPVIGSDGTIYVASSEGIAAINPDGSLKWRYEQDLAGSSPAVRSDGTVYVALYDDVFRAIKPNGSRGWGYDLNDLDDESSPAVDTDGTIYVGTDDGKLYAIAGNRYGLGDAPWPMFRRDLVHTGRQPGSSPSTTIDVSGVWTLEVSNVDSSCGIEPGWTSTVTITQNGNALETTGIKGTSFTVSGSLVGDTVTIGPDDFPDSGGTTTATYTLTVISDGNMTGNESWTWTDGGTSCSGGTADLVATRQ